MSHAAPVGRYVSYAKSPSALGQKGKYEGLMLQVVPRRQAAMGVSGALVRDRRSVSLQHGA